MKTFTKSFIILILFLLIFGSVGVMPVSASTLTVTNNADSGAGSLRDAIASAVNGDTITFNGDYTILLATELIIDKSVTITGAGHNVVVSGNHTTRIFNVSAGSPTFDHLTLTNGSAGYTNCMGGNWKCGGAINVQSGTTAIVTNSTLSNNSSTDGGGAIAIYWGAVMVANSTFTGNVDNWQGGAIDSFYGNLNVRNSTFVNNSIVNGYGGAINQFGGSLTLTNNTFSGNAADRGAGAIDLWWNPTLSASNNIIANSPRGGNCSGALGGSNNLSSDDTCGVPASSSILLGALGNYGGPTPTLPLLPGSAAIDAGDDAVCAAAPIGNLDQRGVVRSQGTHCDIGAFESQGFTFGSPTGSPQSTLINSAFAQPLGLTVTANHASEPVDGGKVTFTAPASGASTNPAVDSATIASGMVAQSVSANGINGGPYSVTASAAGVQTPLTFELTNTPYYTYLSIIFR